MEGDNPIGADDQQETERNNGLDPWWIVGFVDGEGCFSVALRRNGLAKPTKGWQIQPTFQITQHRDHRGLPESIRDHFGAGSVRSKGRTSAVDVFTIHSTSQLLRTVIPFFEQHPLRVKRDDFRSFAHITRAIRTKAHHRPEVFDELVRLAYSMNARGKQRSRPIEEILSGSSETARQAPSSGSTAKIQSDPHGDMGSQAEMIWPLTLRREK